MEGVIFDIKEFTVHDGPGSRSTVFLKGCPLRCSWCHNPEGMKAEQQLLYQERLCSHCGRCHVPCAHSECRPFGRCLHACENGCLTVSGETVTADALAERLLGQAGLLKRLGGGVTLSGGEPLQQADFVCELADRLGGALHKAIQTSGYAAPDVYRRVIERFDYVMQDIKLADGRLHREYTGVDNSRILENIEWLKQSGKEFVFRIPLIPGITDTEENLKAISELVGDNRTELMPYNEFAGAKYRMLGMRYPLEEKGSREEDFSRFFRNAVVRA